MVLGMDIHFIHLTPFSVFSSLVILQRSKLKPMPLRPILTLFLIFTSFVVNAQTPDKANQFAWKNAIFIGGYYSQVNGDGLNAVLIENGLTELAWAPAGYSFFTTSKNKDWVILFANDLTAKRRGGNGLNTLTVQIDVAISGGYQVLDKGVFEVSPYVGIKGFFRGYWLSEILEDNTWSGVLRDEIRDFNFFSDQLSMNLGTDIQIKSKKTNRPWLSLQLEYSPLRSDINFWRINKLLSQTAVVENLFTLRLGFNLAR
jgi:hypothetical protein